MSKIFPPLDDAGDFNDLAVEAGLDAVREQIDAAVAAGAAQEPAPAPAPAIEWPVPMITGTAPPELRADLLPSWLGEYVGALCAATQTPASMAIGPALCVIATCVQRRYIVQIHEGYSEPSAYWSLTVAQSGSRKSAILGPLVAPLAAAEKRAGDRMRREIAATNARISVAEATIKRLQAQAGKTDDAQERERLRLQVEDELAAMPERLYGPCVFLGDATVESLQKVLVEQHGRASVLSDEAGLFNSFSGTYGGGGGPSLDVVLQGHSGGAVRVSRVSRQAFIDRAAVTIGLMLQPDLLNDAAGSNRFRATGMTARFSYFVPGPFVGSRDVRNFSTVPAELRERYDRNVDALLDLTTQGQSLPPTVVPLDAMALELWFDFAQRCELGLAEGGELTSIPEFGAKLAGTAARIALLMELVQAGPSAACVSLESMARAIDLCTALVPHAKAAFKLLGGDEVERDADHVLQWIVRGGEREGVRQSEIHLALRARFTKKERLMAALQRLQGNGCLRHRIVKNQGARQSDVWLINPRLFH